MVLVFHMMSQDHELNPRSQAVILRDFYNQENRFRIVFRRPQYDCQAIAKRYEFQANAKRMLCEPLKVNRLVYIANCTYLFCERCKTYQYEKHVKLTEIS